MIIIHVLSISFPSIILPTHYSIWKSSQNIPLYISKAVAFYKAVAVHDLLGHDLLGQQKGGWCKINKKLTHNTSYFFNDNYITILRHPDYPLLGAIYL